MYYLGRFVEIYKGETNVLNIDLMSLSSNLAIMILQLKLAITYEFINQLSYEFVNLRIYELKFNQCATGIISTHTQKG